MRVATKNSVPHCPRQAADITIHALTRSDYRNRHRDSNIPKYTAVPSRLSTSDLAGFWLYLCVITTICRLISSGRWPPPNASIQPRSCAVSNLIVLLNNLKYKTIDHYQKSFCMVIIVKCAQSPNFMTNQWSTISEQTADYILNVYNAMACARA